MLTYLAIPLLLFAATAQAADLSGHVVGVHDGDTITVIDSSKARHKIRLAGIDAPELKQPYGHASKRNLSAMVFDQDVQLACGKQDKYGRKVCVVSIDGKDVNLAQIEAGMAWWYQKYKREQTVEQRTAYEAAEVAARSARKGMWAEDEVVPPWEWRSRKRR